MAVKFAYGVAMGLFGGTVIASIYLLVVVPVLNKIAELLTQ